MTGRMIPSSRSVIGGAFARRLASERRFLRRERDGLRGSAAGRSGRARFRGQVEDLARRELIQVLDVGIQPAQEPIGGEDLLRATSSSARMIRLMESPSRMLYCLGGVLLASAMGGGSGGSVVSRIGSTICCPG